MKAKLYALYELQQVDSALDAIKRQFAALDRGQTERAHYETVKAAHEEALTALNAAQTEQQDTKLEQEGVEAKRKEVETKLYSGSVRSPKELQAMQDEVDMLARRRERLDEKLLTLMEDAESCRRREKETKKTLAAAITAYNVKASAAQTQTAAFKSQADALTTQRGAQAKEIAPDLLKRYDTMRAAKNGIAVVALEDGNACGGCKMGLPRDIVQRMHEGSAVVLCENCGRMLSEKPK